VRPYRSVGQLIGPFSPVRGSSSVALDIGARLVYPVGRILGIYPDQVRKRMTYGREYRDIVFVCALTCSCTGRV